MYGLRRIEVVFQREALESPPIHSPVDILEGQYGPVAMYCENLWDDVQVINSVLYPPVERMRCPEIAVNIHVGAYAFSSSYS